jgi:hypothetical protein
MTRYRSENNEQPFLKTFGPFPAGLNQSFEVPEDRLFELTNFFDIPVAEEEVVVNEDEIGLTPATHEDTQEDAEGPDLNKEPAAPHKKPPTTPAVFNFIVCLETLGPIDLQSGLEKASVQGMPSPINSQSTFLSVTLSSSGIYDTKIQKQVCSFRLIH